MSLKYFELSLNYFVAIQVIVYELKGVLHPCSILWLFMHFAQKLQHIGHK